MPSSQETVRVVFVGSESGNKFMSPATQSHGKNTSTVSDLAKVERVSKTTSLPAPVVFSTTQKCEIAF